MNARESGFTLWEMMIALLVAGIVLGIGVPNFMEFQRSNAMTAAANDFVTGVLLARGEAVKRQAPVTLCASADPLANPPVCGDFDAADGAYVVFVDDDADAVVDAGDTVLLRRQGPGGTLQAWGDSGYIVYGANGFPREAAGHPDDPATVVLLCDDRGNVASLGGLSSARAVRIEPTGRSVVRQSIADVADAVSDLATAGVTADCP
ncbi:MAG TPA: GspH/FimT family pseudopilin [Gammaproteobacteria bacterium]